MAVRRLALLLALALGLALPGHAADKAGMVTRSLAPRDLVDASVLDEALRALSR